MTDFFLPDEEQRLRNDSLSAAAGSAAPVDTQFFLPSEQPAADRALPVVKQVIPIKPDTAAQAKRLSDASGVPVDTVNRNLDAVKNDVQLQEVHRAMLASPILARQMNDPTFAAIAHDSTPQLAEVAHTIAGTGASGTWATTGGASGYFGNDGEARPIERSAVQSVTEPFMQGLATARKGLTLLEREAGIYNGANAEFAVDYAQRQRNVDKYPIPESVQQGMSEISSAKTMGDAFAAAVRNPNAVRQITTSSLGSSLPSLAMGVLGSVGGRVGAGAGAGIGSFLTEYTSTIDDVLTDKGVSLSDPMAIETAFRDPVLMAQAREKAVKRGLPVGLFDALTAGLAGKLIMGATTAPRSIAARVVGEGVIQAGGGAAGEAVAQAATGDYKPGDILMEALGEIPGGIIEARSNIHHASAHAQAAENNAKVIETALKMSEANKVRERDPSSFENFVNAAAEEGPVQNIHVDAAMFQQAAGERLPELVAAMPSVAEQLPAATASGGDLVIPIGEVMAHIPGTGMEQTFIDHSRTSPDAMTRTEAEAFTKNSAEELEKETQRILANDEHDTMINESSGVVEKELLAQLKSANRFTDDVNVPYAKLASAFYTTTAGRIGLEPAEMYVKYPLQIEADGLGGGSGKMEQGASDVKRIRPTGKFSDLDLSPITEDTRVQKDESSSLLPGLYEVNFNDVELRTPIDNEIKTPKLMEEIRNNKRITPLLVERLNGVLHVREGLHRAHALARLGYDSFPAKIAVPIRDTLEQPAYHGSPHDFDKFSMDKIGTGEGAQAYGHGLYFAENEGVAKGYQERLATVNQYKLDAVTVDGKRLRDAINERGDYTPLAKVKSATAISKNNLNVDAAIADINSQEKAAANTITDAGRKVMQQAREILEGLRGSKLSQLDPETKGALYKVDIPDEAVARMLDWDKPLSEQVPAVREALEKSAGWSGRSEKTLSESFNKEVTGSVLYSIVSNRLGSQEVASKYLASIGIPGIKYLDAGSRSAQDGTRNLVVFDDSLVKITHKNGEPVTPEERASLLQSQMNQPAQGTGRGQITYDGSDITKAPSVISLLAKADLSTFVHELGHFQLEVLANISRQADAPAEIVGDMNAVLKWFGVPDIATWQGMTLEEKRPFHEQFARGFEAYLFEGNAPSQALAKVFAKVRAWMIDVYRVLSKTTTDQVQSRIARGRPILLLSPEVRGVFDRLLATNQEILQAEAERAYEPLFNTAEQMGATDAEWQAYKDQNIEQTQEAVDQLGSRSLRDMRWVTNTRVKVMAAMQRDANEKRKAVQAEVTKEVQAQDTYRAIRWLKTGEMENEDGETVKAEKGYKLNTAALAEMYPETMNARPDTKALRGMTSPDGLRPDVIAPIFGFNSGDQLVHAVIAAEPEASVIDGITDQRMLERYGDLNSEDAISRAADKAIHNEARAKFIATELRTLEKALNTREDTGRVDKNGRKITIATLPRAAKAFAAKIIAAKKIRNLNPAVYSAAEVRAGKAAMKAMQPKAATKTEAGRATGNITEAITEKRNQLVNHYAARAAHEAQDYVDKSVDYLKSVGTRDSIDAGYREQIDAMLERFDLRQLTGKAMDKRTRLAAWIKSQEEQGIEPTISDEMQDEAFRKPYKELTVEEFKGLVDAVKNIEHLGRLKKKLLTAADKREFDAVVSAISDEIKANAKRTIPEQRASDRGFLVGAKRLFRTALAIHRKFASMVRGFDGYKEGGTSWDYLVRSMNNAGNFEAVETEKATEALMKLMAPVVKDGSMTQRQYFPDSGKSFSREERIGIALNMGNETNRERVLSGENLTPQHLDTILNTLTKKDWDFVQGVWDYFDSFRPQIAAKERRVSGVEPTWVEPTPVTTPFGQYRGGYYPIAYDPLQSERSSADLNAEVQRQIQQGLYARAQTARGHTKARVESTGRTLRYDFGDVISRHVTNVVHDLAWHEYLIDANRLLRAPAIEQAVKAHYGVEVLGELKDALKDIAIGSAATEKGAVFWNHIRYGTTIGGLAFNVFNTIQNLTGITQSMSRVGTGWVLKGAAHWAGDAAHFESSIKQIYDKSDFMRLRSKTQLREINELRNKVTGKGSKLTVAYFWLQTQTQKVVDVPTWWGAYEKAMAQDDMSEDKAVALADQAVLDAQGGGQIKDLAGVQRQNGLKLFTTFYSFFNTTLNLTAEAAGRTNFKKPGDVALFTADMVLLYSLPALLSTLLKAGLQGDWDDPDKLKKKLLGDQISYLLGTVVLMREATAGVQAGFGVGEGFGYSGPAATRFFSDIFKAGQQAGQGEADEAFWKSINNVGGTLFHYPSAQINRTASGIAALNDGRTRNPAAIIMGAPANK